MTTAHYDRIRSISRPSIPADTRRNTARSRLYVALVALAMAGFALTSVSGCGHVQARVPSKSTPPDLAENEGLFALPVLLATSQRAIVHIYGERNFTLDELKPGTNFWVLRLPEGMYCTAVVDFPDLRHDGALRKELQPCIFVTAGAMTYLGHYALDVGGDSLRSARNLDDARTLLRREYPGFLERYPLQ
ncbi:MAG: hypothetical protein AAGC55_14445 [Myxococcota bacterium]